MQGQATVIAPLHNRRTNSVNFGLEPGGAPGSSQYALPNQFAGMGVGDGVGVGVGQGPHAGQQVYQAPQGVGAG